MQAQVRKFCSGGTLGNFLLYLICMCWHKATRSAITFRGYSASGGHGAREEKKVLGTHSKHTGVAGTVVNVNFYRIPTMCLHEKKQGHDHRFKGFPHQDGMELMKERGRRVYTRTAHESTHTPAYISYCETFVNFFLLLYSWQIDVRTKQQRPRCFFRAGWQ